MSRKPVRLPLSATLQRQYSMKSDDHFGAVETSNAPQPTRIDTENANSTHNMTEQRKLMDRRPQHSPTLDTRPILSDVTRPRDQTMTTNTRYLSAIDQTFSGHSSLVAVSRVSQQPSFESYDSSMSATSLASSNDHEGGFLGSQDKSHQPHHTQSGYHSRADYYEEQTDNRRSRDRNPRSGISQLKTATSMGGSATQRTCDSDLRNDKDTDSELTYQNSVEEVQKESGKGKSAFRKTEATTTKSGQAARTKRELKIIGSEKEASVDERGRPTSGSQNIKGLWKRAFQSMRKEKTKRDKSTPDRSEKPSVSGEVDPVYHLLRCAASKSQASGLTAGAVGSAKTNEDRPRLGELESPLASTSTPNRHVGKARSTSLRIVRHL
ncbi:hypothetical protein EG68_01984 [Paragonimus skrjabini miyazakii]|uniref:Uncharacterized protein n=1 Tax=Paragonimus skrjabini miyazakii TaxID=59628 RepID=A0A8S9ZBJ3_9TREM|nr:hypothetical protein EG68_01984 [Paragonimus skrjabini miyazakii]